MQEPNHFSRPLRLLDAYIADYLKEEVTAEGLVRNLLTFSDFLDVAAFSDGRQSTSRTLPVSAVYKADFVLGDMRVAIETKSTERTQSDHFKGLRSLATDYPRIKRRIVVCREPRARKTSDGIEIMPATVFVKHLWNGDIV